MQRAAKAAKPEPGKPRVLYTVSDVEGRFVQARIDKWRQAAAAAKDAEREVLELLALIRGQQGIPDSANYSEADRAFVEVTQPAKPAT
jgi:hypothetical protein